MLREETVGGDCVRKMGNSTDAVQGYKWCLVLIKYIGQTVEILKYKVYNLHVI